MQAAYARCIDNGDLGAWPEFFAEQCTYKITTADNHSQGLEAGVVFANSRAMLVDRVTSLREANVYERHTYRHFLGQPWIKSQDGGQVAQRDLFLRGPHHARRHNRHLCDGPLPRSLFACRAPRPSSSSASSFATARGSTPCWRCRYEAVDARMSFRSASPTGYRVRLRRRRNHSRCGGARRLLPSLFLQERRLPHLRGGAGGGRGAGSQPADGGQERTPC